MSRLSVPVLENMPAESKATLDGIKNQLGRVPNLFKVLAISPAVLNGFTNFQGALSRTLDTKTRERIALAVAQVNGCGYCLQAHSYIGLNMAKISAEEIALNKGGKSSDPKANAAVEFAVKVANARGQVEVSDIDTVRAAGFTDAQVLEIVAHVAASTFTNYVNEVAKTVIDFPSI